MCWAQISSGAIRIPTRSTTRVTTTLAATCADARSPLLFAAVELVPLFRDQMNDPVFQKRGRGEAKVASSCSKTATLKRSSTPACD